MGLKENVWQDQFYDHLIRKDESLIDIIKYCWYNPIRKRLVEKPENYPLWISKYELE